MKGSPDDEHIAERPRRGDMLSLREMLGWDILSGHEVIAGERALNTSVQSVTVIDAPDAVNWVRSQEFVVTSTFPVHQSPDALSTLIEQLAARNAAGLGVKLTRYLRNLPDHAKSRAEELGFPIVSLPGGLAWSDLIGKVFAYGDHQHSRETAYLSAIYRAFSQHRSGIDSLHDLFEFVSGFVKLPVVLALENEDGLQIEYGGVTAAEAETLAEMLVDGATTGAQPNDAPLRVTVSGHPVAVARTGMGENGGGMVALIERDHQASDVDLECLRLSVHLLQTLVEANGSGASRAARNEKLLESLLDPLQSAEVRQLMIAARLPATREWHMVVARTFEADAADSSTLTRRLRQFSRRHEAMLRMDDAGEYILAIPGKGGDPRGDDAALRDLLQIFERQAGIAAGFRFALGQSGPAPLHRAGVLHHEARQALYFGIRMNGSNRLTASDDILLFRLLMHPSVAKEGRRSLMRMIEPLLEMGDQGEMLIETLKVWLREDENIPRAAHVLGVHVNTIRQRLDRSRTILRLTDFGTDAKLRLYAALQLLPLLKNPGDAD